MYFVKIVKFSPEGNDDGIVGAKLGSAEGVTDGAALGATEGSAEGTNDETTLGVTVGAKLLL